MDGFVTNARASCVEDLDFKTQAGQIGCWRFEPMRAFCGQGGQFFAILWGRHIWTAPYTNVYF